MKVRSVRINGIVRLSFEGGDSIQFGQVAPMRRQALARRQTA